MPPHTNESVYLLLRKTPFQESSLIVSGITPDFGRVDFLLKGARSVRKRQFPEAELFREFSIIFREAKNADGLAGIVSYEPVAYHDAIAEKPEHYLSACSFAAFLLRNTKPMLPMPETYRAFRNLLTRLETENETEPWLSLARFVYLMENGYVPQSESAAPEHSASADRLMELAMDPVRKLPPDKNDFWRRFRIWIDNLMVWNNLEK